MRFYLAPMEGITGYIYRNAYQEFFSGMDKYITPFLTPKPKKGFTSRELNDILPEHNEELAVIPQLLTNSAEDFLRAGKLLSAYGYKEINLNLGCPSGTVVSKGKGAGFLKKPKELDNFFDEIFAEAEFDISVKTRIGADEPEEFCELLEIYNKYPIRDLMIHPRIRQDYYSNVPNIMVYKQALRESRNPVCYNGDIFSKKSYESLIEECPATQAVMCGRGIIANPGLLRQMKGEGWILKEELLEFHNRIWEGYLNVMSGDKNALYKMKEIWFYMQEIFTNPERYMKKIKKAENRKEYEIAVNSLFKEQELITDN